ncbi:MAG: hypothetical protein KF874_13505 [Rhizobiaceae bacterium]|nr:hypothetical protein [Rhizobiaceae bacterium]
MTFTPDEQALLVSIAEPSVMPGCVPMRPGETISVREAARIAGRSDETVRRWADKFGIGRQFRGEGWRAWKYSISAPALRMILDEDWPALESFRAGDRSSALVARFLQSAPEMREFVEDPDWRVRTG